MPRLAALPDLEMKRVFLAASISFRPPEVHRSKSPGEASNCAAMPRRADHKKWAIAAASCCC